MSDFMTIDTALEIVYQLALQNAGDPESGTWRETEELHQEALRHQTALGVVHDFMLNVVAEDRL